MLHWAIVIAQTTALLIALVAAVNPSVHARLHADSHAHAEHGSETCPHHGAHDHKTGSSPTSEEEDHECLVVRLAQGSTSEWFPVSGLVFDRNEHLRSIPFFTQTFASDDHGGALYLRGPPERI